MRLAFIILCHKGFEQLEILIESLNSDDVDFYVHMDKKVKEFPKLIQTNVYYLADEDRIDVQWASYGMVRATIKLIDKCVEAKKTYDYVVLLSGQDLPIKSCDKMRSFFEHGKRASYNYIDVIDLDNPYHERFCKRTNIYYPKWMTKRNVLARSAKVLYVFFTGGEHRTFSLFQRRDIAKVRPFFGSQWWALQWECVCWMIKYIKNNSWIETFFSNTLVPDESFFQTIFMKSPYAETRRGRIVFLEWEGKHPRIITKDTAKNLVEKENGFLFARKFDVSVDREAIEIITTSLAKNESDHFCCDSK